MSFSNTPLLQSSRKKNNCSIPSTDETCQFFSYNRSAVLGHKLFLLSAFLINLSSSTASFEDLDFSIKFFCIFSFVHGVHYFKTKITIVVNELFHKILFYIWCFSFVWNCLKKWDYKFPRIKFLRGANILTMWISLFDYENWKQLSASLNHAVPEITVVLVVTVNHKQ